MICNKYEILIVSPFDREYLAPSNIRNIIMKDEFQTKEEASENKKLCSVI